MLQLKLWSDGDRMHGDEPHAELGERVEVGATFATLHSTPTDSDTVHRERVMSARRKVPRSDSTRMAYEMDWRLFERWCCTHGELPLPASTTTLTRYLVHLADSGKKPSTIRRARISIGFIHSEHGLRRPDSDSHIRALERVDAAAEQGAHPLLLPDLERMIHALGSTRRDERDRALLLLGFAGAFRSCELVSLDIEDLTLTGCGLRIFVCESKEETFARGSQTDIRRAHDSLLCAVTAVEHWLSHLPTAHGALFRTVYGSRVTGERLAPRAVSRAVQRAAARARLTTEYSSHSLRAGSLTRGRTAGRSERDIQVHGLRKDSPSLERWINMSH